MFKYSFVLANYNKGKYLKQCVNSILNQSYKNIEVILIDDFSNDESKDIISLYYNLENIKIIFHEKNMGKSYTFNEGFRQATGDYITLVGSDDYILENSLDKIDEVLSNSKEKIDMIYGDFYFYNEIENKYEPGYVPKNVKIKDFLFGCNVPSNNTFYSKNLIKNVGAFDEEFSKRGQDYDYMIRAMSYGNVKYLDEKLSVYRIGKNNSVGNLFDLLIIYRNILKKNEEIFSKDHEVYLLYLKTIEYYNYLIKTNNSDAFMLKISLLGTLLLFKTRFNKSSISIYGAGGMLTTTTEICNGLDIKINRIYDKYKKNSYIENYKIQDVLDINLNYDEFIFIIATVDKSTIIDFLGSKGLIHMKNYLFYNDYDKIN